jgi:hypothetical protein
MTYKNQYKNEIKRIKRFISRAEKRGYSFSFKEPQLPKRFRKESVERLKKITPEKLYASAEYTGELSHGKKLTGLQGRKLERSASAKKGAETRKRKAEQKKREQEKTPTFDFIAEIISMINELPNGRYISYEVFIDFTPHKNFLISLINDRADIASQYNTFEKYSNYLNDNKDRIRVLLDKIMHDSNESEIIASFNELAEILKGSALSFEEAEMVEELNQYYEEFVDY